MPQENNILTRSFYLCLCIVGLILVVTFVIVPLMFRLFPSKIKQFIFTPHDELPDNVDYEHPEKAGFIGGRNFYVNTSDGVILGVWHTLPMNLVEDSKNLNYTDAGTVREIYNDWLSDATVFLYLHGSAGSRTSTHRTRIYKLLNQLNYHVITYDYRGYGDSTSFPEGETDLIVDTEAVFSWIRERVVSGQVFVWGHSLGSGVGAHFADEVLNNHKGNISGVVLESAFYNMASAIRSSSILDAISFLPWFEYCFTGRLAEIDMAFESGKHLQNISTPTLILHAKDDNIIPFKYAQELYTDAKRRNDPSTVDMILYNSSLHYGHYNIGLDPDLKDTIRDFVQQNSH